MNKYDGVERRKPTMIQKWTSPGVILTLFGLFCGASWWIASTDILVKHNTKSVEVIEEFVVEQIKMNINTDIRLDDLEKD